jgi:hypothetical protein
MFKLHTKKIKLLMKIFNILLFFFLLFSNAYAQDTVFTYKKNNKSGLVSKTFTSFTAYNEMSGNLHITLVDNLSVERIIIDSNWNKVSHFVNKRETSVYPYRNKFNDYQTFVSNNREYNVYRPTRNDFVISEVDYEKAEEREVQTFSLQRKERVVEEFVTNSLFCIIIAKKNENYLKLITNAKNKGSALDTITVNFDCIDKNTDLEELFQYKGVSFFRDEERERRKLVPKNKIYLVGDTVFIAIDKLNATYVKEVSLNTGKVISRIFKQQTDGEIPSNKFGEKYVHNSFLYNNVLVNGNIYNNTFTISFYNVETEKLLNKFAVPKDSNIYYNDDAIMDRSEYDISTKKFIQKAIKEDNITFAMNRSAKGKMVLGVAVANLITLPIVPTTIKAQSFNGFLLGYTFGNYEEVDVYSIEASFNSTLDLNTFQSTTKEKEAYPEPLLNTLIQEHKKLSKVKCAIMPIVRFGYKNYVSFYDLKSDTYFIKKIGDK